MPPLTAQGSQDVATLMQGLAKQMGLAFVNRGVSVSLRNVALVGGPMEQAQQLAHDARIDLIVDDGEMVISPLATLRSDDGGSTPVWSAKSGMIGYPSFDNEGVTVKGIYEPKLQLGGPVRIESIVPRASGLWQIVSLSHKLQAGYPGATQWISQIKASYPGAKPKKDKK